MIPTQFTQKQPARNKEAAGWVLSLTLWFIWEPRDQGYVDLPRRTTSISNQNRWNLKRPDRWSKRIVSSCMLKDTGLHIIYFIEAHLEPFSLQASVASSQGSHSPVVERRGTIDDTDQLHVNMEIASKNSTCDTNQHESYAKNLYLLIYGLWFISISLHSLEYMALVPAMSVPFIPKLPEPTSHHGRSITQATWRMHPCIVGIGWMRYCWWKESGQPVEVGNWNPTICRVFYVFSGGWPWDFWKNQQ